MPSKLDCSYNDRYLRNRFNGTGFSKDYWRVKSKNFMVTAFANDLEVPGL